MPKSRSSKRKSRRRKTRQKVSYSEEASSSKKDNKSGENAPSSKSNWFSKKLYRSYNFLWLYFFLKLFVVDFEAYLFEVLNIGNYRLFLTLRIFIVPILVSYFLTKKGVKFVSKHFFHFITAPFYYTVYVPLRYLYLSYVVTAKNEGKVNNSTVIVLVSDILGNTLSNYKYILFKSLSIVVLILCSTYKNDIFANRLGLIFSILIVIAFILNSIKSSLRPLRIFGFFKVNDIIDFGNTKKILL